MVRPILAASARVLVAGSLLALSAAASGQTVNLGNLTTTNAFPYTTISVTGLTGGAYNRFTFSTNWSQVTGAARSNAISINLNAGAYSNIIAGLSSISGFNNNSLPSFASVSGSLAVPVSSATALSMIRAQNYSDAGTYAAFWANTTLNFSYQPRPIVLPSGIRNVGVRATDNASFSIVPGGVGGAGGTFNAAVGVYSSEGYLLASNVGAATNFGQGTIGQLGVLGDTPRIDIGLNDLRLPQGTYYVFAGGEGSTFTTDDFAATVPASASGGTLLGNIGDGGWGSLDDATLAGGEGRWYAFTVVPAPGAVSVLSICGVALASNRRRRV